MTAPLLEVEDLRVVFPGSDRRRTLAVDGVSFSVERGKTLGIVGESGCGKSVTSLAVMGLLPKGGAEVSGRVNFEGRDLLREPDRVMRDLRGNRLAMIFQEPMTRLNPSYTVGDQIVEAIVRHRKVSRKEAEARGVEMLRRVRIPMPEARFHDYPHRLSGGMRQRVMIAMALACDPDLLIADEPTTALDVTIQAQILELMRKLARGERRRDHPHHPRSRRRRRSLRRGRRHVCRPGRRTGERRRPVPVSGASLHGRAPRRACRGSSGAGRALRRSRARCRT